MARCPVLRHLDRATDVAMAFSSESLPRLDAGGFEVYADCVDFSALENASSSPIQALDLSFNLWRDDEARTKALL